MSPLTISVLVAAALLLTSVLASKAATRFGVPALLLFLAIGMIAGSERIGGIRFDDVQLTQSIGIVALVLILFSGGLDTPWKQVRPVVKAGASLGTIGIIVSAAAIGAAAHYLLDFPWPEGLLLGTVVSSTDAPAVFSALRSRGVNLKGRLQPLIELESGSNDPMAVFLTLTIIARIVDPTKPLSEFATAFAQQMTVGALAGIALGRAAVWAMNRLRLEYEGLYPVLTCAVALTSYGVTDALHGSGYLAAYLAGIVIGNSRVIHRRSLQRFHDGFAWLMQIAMFLTLGLLVVPGRLLTVAGIGLTIAAVATFVARPLAVFLSLLAARFTWREKLFISWAGLRGAVPIVLATFAMTAELPGGTTIFNIVFFSVLASVLLQGSKIPLAARLLRVTAEPAREHDFGRESDLLMMDIPPSAPAVGRQLVELALPEDVLVLLVYRQDAFSPANGGTTLAAGDRLLIFTSKKSVDDARRVLLGAEAGNDQVE
ncbi:MAG TPA: potassium/proton antiporter [Thermoanaerobaculia bacterium]|nr:potassium/proton antiporter [Thermoanaerobaculia bacterium]